MRKGNNPNKGEVKAVPAPAHIAAVITHLPSREGYHAQRLEVIQTSLTSLRNGAAEIPDLAVFIWDNGSCLDLTDWLQDVFQPDYLMLSPNIGKRSARKAIFSTFSPGTVIALADDDILYYPGWYSAQLKILTTFPDVGAVTGYPTRAAMQRHNVKTLQWAYQDPEVGIEMGRLIPDAWESDYAKSLGRMPGQHFFITKDQQDIRLEYHGLKAWATAHHCQFMGYAGRIAPLCQWSDLAMSHEHEFDGAIDAAGLLRLATADRMTRHIGNILDPDIRAELDAMSVPLFQEALTEVSPNG